MLLKLKSVKHRAVRGSLWSTVGFGGSQVIRLGSNLLLTRLLAPEVFGLMALVQVALQALKMMSDLGITTSVMIGRHGDDPDFGLDNPSCERPADLATLLCSGLSYVRDL